MSKVKKLQTGGTAPQMNGLKFKVNNKDYELDQEMLDAEFQDAINKGIEQGSIKQEDINKYQNIYTNWKDQAKTGKYSIDRRGESFGDMKFEGQPGANIGLTKEGQVGKPSWLRRNVLGQNIDTSDDTQIMAHINSMMGNAIAKHSAVLDKEQTDKLTKEKEEADKAKSEKTKKYGESKFDIFNVMYSGRPDITRQSALTYNWQRLSDKERRNFMMDYYNKLGKTVFDVNYDDPEVMKKLQDRGIDLAAIRGEFTKHGWKEGQFGKDFKGFGGQKSNLMQLLGTNIIDDEWFNKQAVSQQSGSTGTGTGTGTGTETSGTSTTTPAAQQQFAKGRDFYTTLNKAGEREYVLRGKRLSAQELYNYLKSKPNDAFASNIRSAISQGVSAEDRAYGYDPSSGKYGIYHNISESTVPFTARNSQFVFDKGFKGIAANITSLFSNIGKGDKAHVIEYAVPDVFGSRTSKYMIVTPKGRQEGTIYINGAGESIFRTKSGEEVNLGKKMSKLQGNVPTHEFSPFSKGIDTSGRNVHDPLGAAYRMKDGGTIRKFQIGGTAVAFKKQPKQEFQQHKATMAEAFAPGVSMSTADKAALTGLAFDTAGLVASLTGVGSVAGAGLGLAGSASTLVSDITRDGFQWGDVGNFAASAGMDVLSAVPGLGIGAKAGKLAKGVRAAQKVLMPLLIGAGAKSAADVVGKIARGEDVTIQDWRNLASGLHGLVGGVSMAKNIAGTKRATSNFIEANVGGKKQKFQLDEKDLSEINSGKTDADKIELAKLKISEKYNIENPDDIKLDQKLGLKFGLNPFTRTERFKIGTQKGEYQLKDIKQYEGPGIKNMIMRGVVTSAAAQNPNMPGARDIVGEDFNLLGTLGHRARVGKSDDAASTVVGSMRRFSLQPGSLAGQQPVSTTVQRALPIGQTRTPFNVDDEIAGAMSAGRKQSALERQTAESNVQTEEAAARKWETTKAKAKETKQAKAESAEKAKQDEIKKENQRIKSINAKEKIIDIKKTFDIKKQLKESKKKFESRNKSLSKSLNLKTKSSEPIVITKSSGVSKKITTEQKNILSKIKPENRQKFIDNNFKLGGVLELQKGGIINKIKSYIIENKPLFGDIQNKKIKDITVNDIKNSLPMYNLFFKDKKQNSNLIFGGGDFGGGGAGGSGDDDSMYQPMWTEEKLPMQDKLQMSFNKAFRIAKNNKQSYFIFNNKKYSTEIGPDSTYDKSKGMIHGSVINDLRLRRIFDEHNKIINDSTRIEPEMGQLVYKKIPKPGSKPIVSSFKKGGILKAQYGDTFSNINKKFNIKRQFIPGQPVIQSNVNLSQPELTTTQYKAPSAINIPKIDISNIGKTYTKESTGIIEGDEYKSIFKPVVEKISGFAKKIDPVQLSEFARAAAMSALNRGVDTRVAVPLLQQTAEVPMSIKGNPLARFAARNIGSNIMLQARGSQGSDATLNRIAGLQASKQAGDIEFQGALQDADAQARQEAMNLDAQMRYAAGRSDVANRNIAAQAQAENMEREAKNVKSQMIYQPFDVFWANLNKQRMMKDYISKANRSQMRFNELTQPMSEAMVGAKSEYDALYSEMNQNPEAFKKDTAKMSRLNELEKQISRFETDVKNLGLQLEMDPDYTPSKNIFRLPTSSNIRTSGRILQKGGIIEKVNKDMRKTKEKTLSEFAKKSLNLSTYKDDLKQLSLNIKHINDLEKLIFKK